MTEIPQSISATVVADQLLWLRQGTETTVMHVLKLVYLAHGWMLGFHKRPLIIEPVEAWLYGPVIPVLYQKYKYFRSYPISEVPINRSCDLDNEQEEMIEIVNNYYLEYTALELSGFTHKLDSPWDRIHRKNGLNDIIPTEMIQEYYVNLVDALKKENKSAEK